MAIAQPTGADETARAWTLLLVGLAAATVLLLSGPTTSRLAQFAPSALAAIAVAVAVRVRRPAGAGAWLLLAGGRIALSAATLTWTNPRLSTAHDAELAAHLGASLGYTLTAAGLVLLARSLSRLWDRTRWIDSTVVALSIGLVVTVLVVVPGQPHAADWPTAWLLPLYPAVDVFLVLLATRSLLAVRQRSTSLRLLTLGLLVQLVGDVAARWVAPSGVAVPHPLLPACWAVAGLLIGAAALHPSVAAAPGKAIPWRRLGPVRFCVLVASLVAPLAALVALAVLGRATVGPIALLAVGSAVIGVLLILRVSGLVDYADALADERHRSRFEALAHHSSDAIIILDERGSVTWASPALRTVLGADPASVAGHGLGRLLGEQAHREVAGPIEAAMSLPTGTSTNLAATIRRHQGADRAVEGVATNLLADPAVGGVVVALRDITQRAEMERQLVERALVDPLTGLANRALFVDRVTHALTRSHRADGREAAILFIDLDDFKTVNDSLGHGPGDDLLVVVGRRIAESIGPADTAARLGGDEFGVLLEDVTAAQAVSVADRVLQLLAIPLQVGDFPLAVSASVGVALAGAESRSADSLLRNADLAMYEAKREGKGQVRTFRAEMHERELRQFTYRSDLGAALDRGELKLLYQPIVDMVTEQVVGAEALIRWEHPDHGTVSPVDFIPVAEATRAIIPIGRWVLETACRQLAAWGERFGAFSMDINVSPIQLLEADFPQVVAAVLAETGVDPRCVVLELTESLLVHDADDARRALEALRALGVRTAIDDFGTGYSSLAYLQNFPIDIVKIDRAFVSQLGGDDRGRSLARSIITIAGSLGIDTIAEGIETPAQAADVTALSCMHGQGWHYGRPVDPTAFEAIASDPGARTAAATLAD